MKRAIESSHGASYVAVAQALRAELYIQPLTAEPVTYFPDDIAKVVEVDAETFRSGGKAAAGAVVGGLLTGGLGALAGAAIGGRRRQTGTFIVFFNDQNYVAFEEKNSMIAKALRRLAIKTSVNDALPRE